MVCERLEERDLKKSRTAHPTTQIHNLEELSAQYYFHLVDLEKWYSTWGKHNPAVCEDILGVGKIKKKCKTS
jgi:hypothetical protein